MSNVTVTHEIMTSVKGEMGDVLNAKVDSVPTLAEVLDVLKNITFATETVAHLRDMPHLLEYTDKARSMLAIFKPA